MRGPTIIAVDWSGAKGPPGQRKGIVLAIADGTDVTYSGGRTREETIEQVEQMTGPLVIGFDFSFGLPAWFAAERGCRRIADVWQLAATDGETWLLPTAPFWRDRCDVPPEQRFRRCEERVRGAGFPAKSIFQLVGNGQVGAGSVRGMPLLARLRAEGFAIWPFDGAAERTVIEIYPSLLRKVAPHHDVGSFANAHERDAVASARVMWDHRDELAALTATTDLVTRIEGDVWTPTSSL